MKSFFMGIDVGSLSTDGVIIDDKGTIIKTVIFPTGASITRAIIRCREELILNFNKAEGEIKNIVSTGYGRKKVEFASQNITEITAHTLGALYYFPDARTIIDIGGQDTKAILVSHEGGVQDFIMNDRCAAGTGRFIEVMARLLETDLEGMAKMAINAKRSIELTSTCTVFAESEIISLISESEDLDAIAAGIFFSIARRIFSMVRGLGGVPPFILTGGVAKNAAMVEALKKILPGEVRVPTEPQASGALGAALFARKT